MLLWPVGEMIPVIYQSNIANTTSQVNEVGRCSCKSCIRINYSVFTVSQLCPLKLLKSSLDWVVIRAAVGHIRVLKFLQIHSRLSWICACLVFHAKIVLFLKQCFCTVKCLHALALPPTEVLKVEMKRAGFDSNCTLVMAVTQGWQCRK